MAAVGIEVQSPLPEASFPPYIISRASPLASVAILLKVNPSSRFLSSEKASTLLLQLPPLGPGLVGFGLKSRPKVSPKNIPYLPDSISQTMPRSVPPTFQFNVLLGLGNVSPDTGAPVTRAIRLTLRIKKPHRLSTFSEISLEIFPSR